MVVCRHSVLFGKADPIGLKSSENRQVWGVTEYPEMTLYIRGGF